MQAEGESNFTFGDFNVRFFGKVVRDFILLYFSQNSTVFVQVQAFRKLRLKAVVKNARKLLDECCCYTFNAKEPTIETSMPEGDAIVIVWLHL